MYWVRNRIVLHCVFLENAMVHFINPSVIGFSSACSKKIDAQGALGRWAVRRVHFKKMRWNKLRIQQRDGWCSQDSSMASST